MVQFYGFYQRVTAATEIAEEDTWFIIRWRGLWKYIHQRTASGSPSTYL